MFSKEIVVSSPEAAKKFVDTANKYQDITINLRNGDYLIDGHSIMGLLSLDSTQKTELVTDDNPSDEFIKDMEPFFVEA